MQRFEGSKFNFVERNLGRAADKAEDGGSDRGTVERVRKSGGGNFRGLKGEIIT